MDAFRKLKPAARAYVVSVVLLGGLTLAYSFRQLYVSPISSQWFILAGLTLLTGSFTVKVPSTNASLSVSETFVFTSVLLFGPEAGAVTVVLECLVILFWMKPKGRAFHRILFNLAAPSIAIWSSGTLFYVLSGIDVYSRQTTSLQGLFFPLLLFTALYFLLNSSLVAIALGFETGGSALYIWWTNFTWLSVNYFSGASVAALLVTYTRQLDIRILGIIVPLLVVSYLTFRTAMGRVEDSNNHLSELNRLYLSTIETLAMAIDAKDQITHGHIRRVQTYAVSLATQVGVSDPKLIKAIEAAALLHDMGKLAVPEYILNKPGRLTVAEFEKMKLHASVGADILSAIEFPYPVVPIVRHHHENWDGTGYPAGLRGTEIPIGARILAVVDCFDALTSDRPYRPRLPDDDAVAILLQRRGVMYDPLIVDTFIKIQSQIVPEGADTKGLATSVLNEITTAASVLRESDYPSVGFDDIAAGSGEARALFDLAQALTEHPSPAQVSEAVASRMRRLVPFALVVFYSYDSKTDEVVAMYAVGESASLVRGIRIPIAQRLSGWVAANQQTIVNSDAMLDLGEIAKAATPRLRTCLSTPLMAGSQLVGVLTIYSSSVEDFTDDHRRIMETVAQLVASVFRGDSTDATKSERPVQGSRDTRSGGQSIH